MTHLQQRFRKGFFVVTVACHLDIARFVMDFGMSHAHIKSDLISSVCEERVYS